MMRIGLDFDNTIINYDQVFYKIAIDAGYIDESAAVSVTKQGVRDHLRSIDAEDNWTKLQGLVYGKEILKATPYAGARETIKKLIKKGDKVIIISHKTRTPFLGPKYDLHAAAHRWLSVFLKDEGGQPLIAKSDIYFNETLNQKLEKIELTSCDIFLDDLVEVLTNHDFPISAQRVYFNPNFNEAGINKDIETVNSWQSFLRVCDEIRNKTR